MAKDHFEGQRGFGRRRLLRVVPAAAAVWLAAGKRADAGERSATWAATATFVATDGARLDPEVWPSGERGLRRSAEVSILAIVLPHRASDSPHRLDVDVCCGPQGQQRFHAWAWRADDASDGSRSLSFVAPVHDDDGLRLELTVDGQPPIAVQLHAGEGVGLAKLRSGEYDVELYRIGSGDEATTLRIAIAAVAPR